MVLRCSLLGHDYGDTDVEREREERGSEVVVTVQEYEECARCGERNVISENTEVTSLSAETAADALPDEYELESDTTAPTDGDAVETPPDAAAEAGTEVEFSEAEDADLVDADESEDDFEIPTDENGDPVTDDAEILEDEPTRERDRDREHGEWPESDDVGPPVGAENEPVEWPDSGEETAENDGPADFASETAEDEAIDGDEQITDDAVVLEDDAGSVGESPAAADARSVTTTTPGPADARDGDATRADASASSGSGIERAGAAPTPGQSGGTARDDVPTEFFCPRCDYVAASDRGSLRAGDICPDCRKGYLGERER